MQLDLNSKKKDIGNILSCIYKITNPKGRVYIGQTVNLWRRFRSYRSLHISIKSQVKLYKSLTKYGFDNHIFEVLKICTKDQLNLLEKEYIELYSSTTKRGLNCLGGGKNLYTPSKQIITKRIRSLLGKECTKETRLKIGIANKGDKNGMYGKIAWNRGKKHSNESIEKMKKNAFIHKPMLGKKHSEDTLKFISKKTKGKNMGRESPQFKGYILVHTLQGIYIGRYEGLREAEKATNIDFRLISKVLNGKSKQTKGYVFTRETSISFS